MSARILLLLALLAMGASQTGLSADVDAQPFAPKTYGIGHYENIWKRSPFIVETVAVVDNAGLATKYGLVGIAWLGKSPVVFLLDKRESDPGKQRFMVSKSKPDTIRNIEIVSVAVDKDPRKSTATIKQGSDVAPLNFDASALPPTGPVSMPGLPGIPSPTGGYVPSPMGAVPPPPTGITAPPGMNPSVRINRSQVAPSYPVPTPAQLIPNPPGQTPPTPTRRIIRPQSKTINVN